MALAITAVAESDAEMGLQMITEIPGVSGIELVGPVPAHFNAYVDFDAAVPANSAAPEAARVFIKYMTRSERRRQSGRQAVYKRASLARP